MKKAPICWYPKPADRCLFPAMNFLVQKKGALFVFIFQKGHLAFSESVLVQIPTVPEKTVSRSFVFRLKLRSEKPRKRPIGCAFTRIRSKLTIIDGGDGGTRTLAPVSRPTPLAGAPLHQLEYISIVKLTNKIMNLFGTMLAERVGFEPTALSSHRFSRPAP